VVVEELELRITTCHEKGVEEEAGYERANQALAAARVLVGKAVNTPANSKSTCLCTLRRLSAVMYCMCVT
jgi:hypothetical protein